MKIETSAIKEIREKTGLPIMDCRKALEEADNNAEKALELLKKRGIEIALKKNTRKTSQGLISSYIHSNGKIGVLLEVNCETDFVAKTEDFSKLLKNLALQIAAMAPITVEKKDIAPEIIAERKKWWNEEFAAKPEKIREKIIAGKLKDFYREKVLLEQDFIKDEDITIRDYLTSVIAKVGENITIRRFIRYELGEARKNHRKVL